MSIDDRLTALRAEKSGSIQPLSNDVEDISSRLKAIRESGNAVKQPTQQEQSVVSTEEPNAERNWYDPIRELGEGLSFGFADEAGSALAAAIAKYKDGDERDFGDVYNEMKDIVENQREQYQQNHPAEALGLNVLGGLATGGAGASKVLAKNSGKLVNALKLSGLGAAEAGIQSMGSARRGETFDNLSTDMTVGALLPQALKGIGKGVEQFAKRKVTPDIFDEAGNQIPLNLIADKGSDLQNKYQQAVAPSWFGGGIRDKSRRALEKTTQAADEAKNKAEQLVTQGKKTDDAAFRAKVRDISLPGNASDEVRAAVKNLDGQEANLFIKERWADGFDMVKGRTFDINPTEIVKDAIDELSDDPAMAKFAPEIARALNSKLKKGFTPNTEPPLSKFTTKGMSSVKTPNVELPTGKADGNWLMQARNDLKMTAADLGNEGQDRLHKAALNKASGRIDKIIYEQLGEKGDDFIKELDSWGNAQSLRGATKPAVRERQGLATAEDILGQTSKYDSAAATVGEARLQQPIQALQREQASKLKKALAKQKSTEEVLSEIQSRMPNLAPKPYQQGAASMMPANRYEAIAAGLAGVATPLASGAAAITPTRRAFQASDVGQRLAAGQTDTQKIMNSIAEILRQQKLDSNISSAINRGVATEGVEQELF